MRISARSPIVLAVATAAAAVLVACGGSSGNSSGSGNTPAAGAAGSASASVAGTAVTSTEKEYSIDLSMSTFAPGTYTFTVKNTGTMAHDLVINGPGVDHKGSSLVQAGDTGGQFTVTLQSGSYELWCSVPGHKQLGMDKKIQVG